MSYLPDFKGDRQVGLQAGDRLAACALDRPGPLIAGRAVAWPSLDTTNVYLPAGKVCWDNAMWNSVRLAVTRVPDEPAGAEPFGLRFQT
jgi:hypothetical protein